jgi:hypothetical protein
MNNRIVLLNTSILTDYGTYKYSGISVAEAIKYVGGAKEAVSAIGHQSTADILTELLGLPVKVNRINYRQEIGDIAIVFKLSGRPEEGKILSRSDIEAIGYSFGLMTKID